MAGLKDESDLLQPQIFNRFCKHFCHNRDISKSLVEQSDEQGLMSPTFYGREKECIIIPQTATNFIYSFVQ